MNSLQFEEFMENISIANEEKLRPQNVFGVQELFPMAQLFSSSAKPQNKRSENKFAFILFECN